MRHRLILALTLCLAVPATATAGPREDVAAATAAWVAAYDSRDPGRITALYDIDAVFWGTTARSVATTPVAVAEYFKDAGKRPDGRVTLGEQHIRVFGDVAVNTGTYTFSDVRDGKPVTSPSRFSFTYRLRNGRWMIVDHHSSSVPAPRQ